MTDAEILRMKLNLTKCSLNNKQKEEFLAKLDDIHDVFSLRDKHMSIYQSTFEIKGQNSILCKTLPYVRRTEESDTKGNGQARTFRCHLKRTDWLQLTSCPSQKEKSKFI